MAEQMDEETLLAEETQVEPAPQTLESQLAKMQASIERALRKVIETQGQLQLEVAAVKNSLKRGADQSDRSADSKRDSVDSKKARRSCEVCKGEHPEHKCKKITPAERIAHAAKMGLCLNCNGKHEGHCRRSPACPQCKMPHLALYHI